MKYSFQFPSLFLAIQGDLVLEFYPNQINCCKKNCISGVMVSVLASSAVDRGFKPWLGKTKDYQIGICCFSRAKHAALRSKSKDWLAPNQSRGQKLTIFSQ
jgi:hypothetical protein